MTSFADVATHDPARGLYGESAVTTQERTSFAPLLLSLEMWTPHRYASQALRFVAHVVNDDDDGQDLPAGSLHWALVPTSAAAEAQRATPLLEGSVAMPAVEYYGTAQKSVTVELQSAAAGQYTLTAELRSADGTVLAKNEDVVEVFDRKDRSEASGASVVLYEPVGDATALALIGVGVAVRTVSAAELRSILSGSGPRDRREQIVIAENSWDHALQSMTDELRHFVDETPGRVLVMQQADAPEAFSVSWMPGAAAERLQQYPRTQLIMHSGLTVGRGRSVHPTRMSHPVFQHPHAVTREQMLTWNDPGNWSEASPGDSPTPDQSPAAHGLFINSSNVTAEIAVSQSVCLAVCQCCDSEHWTYSVGCTGERGDAESHGRARRSRHGTAGHRARGDCRAQGRRRGLRRARAGGAGGAGPGGGSDA